MGQIEEQLPPVEEIFNPHSEEYMNNPVPQCLALLKRGRLVWYEPWQAWIMTRMDDIMECWKQEPLSSDFYDWEFAPPRPPSDKWSNFERAMIGHSLLADHDHHRLVRKVVSPAFSRNVVDKIQAAIEPDVKKLFDDLGTPAVFDYKEKIAFKPNPNPKPAAASQPTVNVQPSSTRMPSNIIPPFSINRPLDFSMFPPDANDAPGS